MYCPTCGNKLDEKNPYCPLCEKTIGEDIISAFDYIDTSKKKSASKYCYLTVALGLLSICLCVLYYLGIPYVHIIGIFLGIVSLALTKSISANKKIFSLLGVITGMVGMLLGVAAFLYGLILHFL